MITPPAPVEASSCLFFTRVLWFAPAGWWWFLFRQSVRPSSPSPSRRFERSTAWLRKPIAAANSNICVCEFKSKIAAASTCNSALVCSGKQHRYPLFLLFILIVSLISMLWHGGVVSQLKLHSNSRINVLKNKVFWQYLRECGVPVKEKIWGKQFIESQGQHD